MPDKPLIEVREIQDDPQQAISDVVSPDVRREVKKLTPTEFQPGQGKALYRQLLPGILQFPADWVVAWGRLSGGGLLTALLGHAQRPIFPRSSMIFFWRAWKASISASGRGGQPGT